MCVILIKKKYNIKLISLINMIGWIIQIAIISFIFIYLVHHLLVFFKNMLTIPKVKDLVETPNKKYEDIFNTIKNSNSISSNSNNTNGFTDIDLLPSNSNSNSNSSNDINNNSMKDELKNFLKKQLNSSNELQTFQPSGSTNMFSDF